MLKLEGLTGTIRLAQFSPNEKIIVTHGKAICIWDVETGKVLQELERNTGSLFFSSDEKRILVKNWDGITVLYIKDTEGGTEVHNIGRLPNLGREADYSPDGTRIIGKIFRYFGNNVGVNVATVDLAAIDEETIKQLAERETKRRNEEARRAEEQQIAEKNRQIALEKRTAEREAMLTKAPRVNEELRKSGLGSISEFAQFGNAEWKNTLQQLRQEQQGDALERARAAQKIEMVQQEIEATRAEIAQKIFLGEYEYTYDDSTTRIDLNENTSSFQLTIPTGFGSSSVQAEQIAGSEIHTRMSTDGASHMILAINGSIEVFEKLVQGKNKHRANVWFTNLRYEDGRTAADVLKIEIVNVQ